MKYAFNKDPVWVGSKGVLVSQHRASGMIMGRARYKNKKYSFEVMPYNTVFVCVSVKHRGPETIDVQVITPTGKLMYLLYLNADDTLQLLDELPTP